MTDNTTATVIQVVLSVVGSGALVAAINAFITRRKTSAEAESIAITTTTNLLEGVNKQMALMETRLEAAETKVTTAEARARSAERRAEAAESRNRDLVRIVRSVYQRLRYMEEEATKAGLRFEVWAPDYDVDEILSATDGPLRRHDPES